MVDKEDNRRVINVLCPRCNGKGHIFDRMTILAFNVLTPLFAYLDADNSNGATRKECPVCDGKGYKEIPA